MNSPANKICAIYTRKSTDEGLDQAFNSLDAQREACEAYIKSQAHEGWRQLEDRFDDGGISGGTMERSGLKRLLALIEEGKVDIIVVYKVDRLTRSLSDFARMVDLLDAKGASFVSVTQQFNTTNSMGRLTLNVLLSFAQFEREVTAERIRDKFKASKEKGMWMGGHPPLGYDIASRHLVVNEEEAETIRMIFRRYIELGSIMILKDELGRKGLTSKARITASGRHFGGNAFTRGALYTLIGNKTYLGEVDYKGKVYEGEHEAIVSRDLWDAAQRVLTNNRVKRQSKSNTASQSFLKGLLFDEDGNAFSPSHAVKQGKRYRYYQTTPARGDKASRLPAPQIEGHVTSELRRFFQDPKKVMGELQSMALKPDAGRLLLETTALAARLASPFEAEARELVQQLVRRLEIGDEAVRAEIDRAALAQIVTRKEYVSERELESLVLDSNIRFKRSGSGVKLVIVPHTEDRNPLSALHSDGRSNMQLVQALKQAHVWLDDLTSGKSRSFADIALRENADKRHIARTVRLAFLAPDIVGAILAGREPVDLSPHRLLKKKDFPLHWNEQLKTFGSGAFHEHEMSAPGP